MRTVISVIDLQSDLERERSRCARKGDPDKAGLLGIFIQLSGLDYRWQPDVHDREQTRSPEPPVQVARRTSAETAPA